MFEITIDLKTPNKHLNCDKSENTQDTGMRLSIAYVMKFFFFLNLKWKVWKAGVTVLLLAYII
jgi:hypothetical protein